MTICFQLKFQTASSETFDPAALLQSKPFENIFRQNRKTQRHRLDPKNPTHDFKIDLPALQKNKRLCLTGSFPQAGNFEQDRPALFRIKKSGRAVLKLDLSAEQFPLKYKLAIFDSNLQRVIEYESGPDRTLEKGRNADAVEECNGAFLQHHLWKGAGVNIPLFSLRSENSWGTGDFADMELLTDFCATAGLKLIQLLPLNDTTAAFTDKDSYPYAAISAFALDPKYLCVAKIAAAFSEEIAISDDAEAARLNALPEADHPAVSALKIRVLRKIFQKHYELIAAKKKFHAYIKKQKEWLLPYAAFCLLRDKFGTADFNQWKEFSVYDEHKIKTLSFQNEDTACEVLFWCFVQYNLHRQLRNALKYAHKKRLVLKADLPIGVGRQSADTWQHPPLFHMNMQAGAPPDAFSSTGQNWTFPTYNMAAMAADDFAWFRKRMKHLERYFDAVRIDHVLGFFRIWSIPLGFEDGRFGRFVTAVPLTPADFEHAGITFDENKFCEPNSGGDASDVILLKENDGYHFTINMQQTQSFARLPEDEKAALNKLYAAFFKERQRVLWEKEGREKLSMLKDSTAMMVCAEDLGMVPEFAPRVLHELGILSLQVQQMPKDDGAMFSDPASTSYLSVVMPGTHDMSPVRLWWEQDRVLSQQFYNQILKEEGAAPYFCEPWICKKVIDLHLDSPAMWSIFLLQDLMAISDDIRRSDPRQERINDPANKDHVWNYRMHMSLEKLIADKTFVASLKQQVKESGR